MKTIYLLSGLMLLLMTSSCEKGNCGDEPDDCAVGYCTSILVTVPVQVKTFSDKPVSLDEVYTVRVKTNEKITYQQNMGGGRYYVLDDSYQRKLKNRSEQFQFVGVKNGRVVISEMYTISADCCHIKKVSGKDLIVIAD